MTAQAIDLADEETSSAAAEPGLSHYDRLCRAIAEGIGVLLARSVCNSALKRVGMTRDRLERTGPTTNLVDQLVRGTEWFCDDESKRELVAVRLGELGTANAGRPSAEQHASVITVSDEDDAVEARACVRRMAQALGFGHTDQVKLATAVSEVARNIYRNAQKGTISITASSAADRPAIHVVARDDGPGIPNLDDVLARSKSGLGLGLVGCRNLMDEFQIVAPPGGGTCVTMTKFS